jgi:hypothetical protein
MVWINAANRSRSLGSASSACSEIPIASSSPQIVSIRTYDLRLCLDARTRAQKLKLRDRQRQSDSRYSDPNLRERFSNLKRFPARL